MNLPNKLTVARFILTPLFMAVMMIDFPYHYFVNTKGRDYTNDLLNDLYLLMEKYNIVLSLVDTSKYNHPIFMLENHTYKKIKR